MKDRRLLALAKAIGAQCAESRKDGIYPVIGLFPELQVCMVSAEFHQQIVDINPYVTPSLKVHLFEGNHLIEWHIGLSTFFLPGKMKDYLLKDSVLSSRRLRNGTQIVLCCRTRNISLSAPDINKLLVSLQEIMAINGDFRSAELKAPSVCGIVFNPILN